MNILIIGFGTAGQNYFNILKKNKEIKKIYICEKNQIPISNKYKKIEFNISFIKKLKIRYAFISTPSNLHYKYSKLLLEHSINVLIEKPFVLKISHAKDLINISNKKKVKCWVAFQNRHNLAIQKLKKVVKEKKLGKIFLTDCSLFWKRDKKYYRVSWRGKYSSDGGVLSNQAIHLIDAAIYIFGEVSKFTSIIRHNKKKLEAEDLAVLNFVHKNGLITNIKATTRADANYRSAMDVIGEQGRALVKGISLNTFHIIKQDKIKNDKNNSEEFQKGEGQIGAMGSGHFKIIKEFIDKKNKNSSKDLEISKNLHVLYILHSIYNSKNDDKFSKVTNRQSKLGV